MKFKVPFKNTSPLHKEKRKKKNSVVNLIYNFEMKIACYLYEDEWMITSSKKKNNYKMYGLMTCKTFL